ncbi:MAG: glycosyltransferase family 2 protein [Ilyomonas sp.]
MISIITAIHNGLSYNQLFVSSLKKYTNSDYELIIIDNASTDGSHEFFKKTGAKLILNKQNLSYPVCQNMGIQEAKSDHIFFLNNDLILSPSWDTRLIETATLHNLDIVSACGVENMGDFKTTRRFSRKWKRAKNLLLPFGFGKNNLRLMHKLMYGNWEKFCEERFKEYDYKVVEGIVGNNVMITRKGLNIAGLWDERIQAADFDLFMRSKKISLAGGGIKPSHIALGVYIHHYIRMTSKYAVKAKPFSDIDNLIGLSDKWTKEELDLLHPDNETIRKK